MKKERFTKGILIGGIVILLMTGVMASLNTNSRIKNPFGNRGTDIRMAIKNPFGFSLPVVGK